MDRAVSLESRPVNLAVEPSFELGPARVDPSAHTVAWGNQSRRLQPQTIKVLVALHDKLDQVVTRDELIDRCWDGRFIGDDAVNRCISILRRVSAESGGIEIETVPKGGYRLLRAGFGDGSDKSLLADVSLAKRAFNRRVLVLGGGATGLALAITGGRLLEDRAPALPSTRIAVLPFANLTGDPSQTYFSDGIAEELRSALSRAGMQVIGSTSSEAVRGMDARTIAAKLGVASILTGSVRRAPGKIRIDAQLIRSSDGVQRWSQSYDRAPGDVIEIQTDIAERVATEVTSVFAGATHTAITAGGTRNANAQRLLLQALASTRSGTQVGVHRALELFDQAIAVDRNYADAYARKAYYLEYYAENFASTVAEVNFCRSAALQSAKIALHLAPNLSRAHWGLANYLQGVLDVSGANDEYRKAVALAPGDAGPLSDHSLLVLRIGSGRQALSLVDRALALDPLDPDAYRRRFLVLYYRRAFDAAVAFSQSVKRYSPELFIWPADLGLALISLNRFDEARRYLEQRSPDYYQRLVGECVILSREGRRADCEAKLARFRELFGNLDNYQYAQIYSQLGYKDMAFAALNLAWSVRDTGLLWVRVDPLLDPIRRDPRLRALLQRMNLQPVNLTAN